MKKTVITVLSFVSAICTLFSAIAFTFNVAYANSSSGNITTDVNEQPLDSLVEGGGLTSIFDKIAIVGDSLSSGALEDHQQVGAFLQDVTDYSWGTVCGENRGEYRLQFDEKRNECKRILRIFCRKQRLLVGRL